MKDVPARSRRRVLHTVREMLPTLRWRRDLLRSRNRRASGGSENRNTKPKLFRLWRFAAV